MEEKSIIGPEGLALMCKVFRNLMRLSTFGEQTVRVVPTFCAVSEPSMIVPAECVSAKDGIPVKVRKA
jgi:hypothetical protein|tara:strand:- start:6142 stop:6345 length:204 start_codon:yes stop_codon:yes gene_type:complete